MRFIHPAAWAGLILNCGLVYFLYSMLQGAHTADLSEQEAAVINLFVAARPVILAVLLAQALSLGLIAMRLTVGLVLGCAAGGLMLPAGFVFIVGCLLSHHAAKYARFPFAPRGFAGARRVFRSGHLPRLRLYCGVTGLLAVFLFTADSSGVGSIVLGLALAGAFLSLRANAQHPLALFGEHFTLAPEFMAPRLAVRYGQVRSASLFPDESILFDVETDQGPARLTWALTSLRKEDRQAAVDELGLALSAHGAQLR